MDQIISVKRVLRCFEICSSFKINFYKSFLIGVNVQEEFVANCARKIKCKTGHLPFSYLGVPIGARGNAIATWDPVILKIERKLALWKTY